MNDKRMAVQVTQPYMGERIVCVKKKKRNWVTQQLTGSEQQVPSGP